MKRGRKQNIEIAIKNEDELKAEPKEVWEKIEKGVKVKKHEGLYFESLEAMRKVLRGKLCTKVLKMAGKGYVSDDVYEELDRMREDCPNRESTCPPKK